MGIIIARDADGAGRHGAAVVCLAARAMLVLSNSCE
jgi:hypothetical protein